MPNAGRYRDSRRADGVPDPIATAGGSRAGAMSNRQDQYPGRTRWPSTRPAQC